MTDSAGLVTSQVISCSYFCKALLPTTELTNNWWLIMLMVTIIIIY